MCQTQVCDGRADCANREDEDRSFCSGCTVGQRMCKQGNFTRPICLDQVCKRMNKCATAVVSQMGTIEMVGTKHSRRSKEGKN